MATFTTAFALNQYVKIVGSTQIYQIYSITFTYQPGEEPRIRYRCYYFNKVQDKLVFQPAWQEDLRSL